MSLRVGMARVADQDCSLLDAVSWSSVGSAPVNGVLVVEAAAGGVELNDFVAHCEDWLMRIGMT